MNGTGPAAPAKQAAFGSNNGKKIPQKGQQTEDISSTVNRGRAKVSSSVLSNGEIIAITWIVVGLVVFLCKLASLAGPHSDCLGRTISSTTEWSAGDGMAHAARFRVGITT